MGINKYILVLVPFLVFSNSDLLLEDFDDTHGSLSLETKQDSSKFFSFDKFFKRKKPKDDYHIALLLPFCSESNEYILNIDLDSLIEINQNLDYLEVYKRSRISIDFYLGFLLSLDKISNDNVKISLFDIKEGDASIDILDTIIDKDYLNDVDFIIGPLYPSNFKYFSSNFSLDIPILSPFSKKEFIVKNNRNVIQVQSNMFDRFSLYGEYIFLNHQNDNILLVRRDTIFETSYPINDEKNKIIIDTIIPDDIMYTHYLLNDIDSSLVSFREIQVNANVIDSIHHELDTLGMRNVIIIPSEDNVFVTDLLSKLHASRDTSMIVYGLPALSKFDHVSLFHLMDMNLTFFHNQFDLDSLSSEFLINFHNTYDYVPVYKYSSVGYEVGLYFLSLLFENGAVLPYIKFQNPERILNSLYDFQRVQDGGYRNQGFSIFRYSDFKHKQIF